MDFNLSQVKKEYLENDINELEEHVLSEAKTKKKRGEYEKETLIKILACRNIESVYKVANDRLLEIRRGEEYGWSAMEELNTAKELGIDKNDLALITQMKSAKLQEGLLKAQIKAAKAKPFQSFRGYGGQSRGRGSNRGRGGASTRGSPAQKGAY